MFCMKNGVEYNKTLHEEIHKNNSITQMPKEDDFLTKYGHYIGLFLSAVYIIGILYYIIHT